MDNYSFLEKVLHKFALSSQFFREVAFDVETSIFSKEVYSDKHVFISGLARAGTTILLNSIYQSDTFASLTYADMPFVLAPNLWSKISFIKSNSDLKERAHGDGIKFSTESPEAFEEVFWKTFDEDEEETFDKFNLYINNILTKYKKRRYLSKNNQNIRRISKISNFFPRSKILIPFRDPLQHSYSLLRQHEKFINLSKENRFISKYMELIGHTEFGPNYIAISKRNLLFKNPYDINHWIEQWYLTYKDCLDNLIYKKNVHFISYAKLCNSREYWFSILDLLEINNKYHFKFKEAKKKIADEVDSNLIKKTTILYSELSKLNLVA